MKPARTDRRKILERREPARRARRVAELALAGAIFDELARALAPRPSPATTRAARRALARQVDELDLAHELDPKTLARPRRAPHAHWYVTVPGAKGLRRVCGRCGAPAPRSRTAELDRRR